MTPCSCNESGGMGVYPPDQATLQDTDLTYGATYTAIHRGFLAQRRSKSTRPVRLVGQPFADTSHTSKRHCTRDCLPGGCDPPCLLDGLLAADALRCGILQLRSLGKDPRSSSSRPASILVTDAAMVLELCVPKVPTNPASSSAGACEKDITRGVACDTFVNVLDGKHGETAVAGHGAHLTSITSSDSTIISWTSEEWREELTTSKARLRTRRVSSIPY